MMTSQNEPAKIMRFFQLFRATYLKKAHSEKKIGSLVHKAADIRWSFEVQISPH